MMRFIWLYFVLSLIHLAGYLFSIPAYHLYTKPFLMPVLAFSYWITTQNSKSNNTINSLLLAALACSALGDILLQLEKIYSKELFFQLGLAAFLTAHILYILLFRKFKPIKISATYLIVYLTFLFALLILVVPHVPGILKFLVILYGAVITTMAWNSWACAYSISSPGISVVIGSILFIISDSVLAINKFYTAIPYSSVLIMVTYLSAQYFIVKGIYSITTHAHPYQAAH